VIRLSKMYRLSHNLTVVCRDTLQVLTALLLIIHAFWIVTPCRWTSSSSDFEGLYCRHLQDQTVFGPEMKTIRFFKTPEASRHDTTSQKIRNIVNYHVN